jgi:hypothetical protein
MFEVDLKSQVPKYGSDNPNWGGAACCQMAMDGYPSGATSCYINQTTIWNYIQAHNKEPGYSPSSWDYGWYADPYAVTKALNDLCPPQHSWVDVSGTNKETVLYTLFRYMANYQYASLICTWMHDYWATLVYYKTSDDPRAVSNPTLERVGWYEPYYSSWLGGPQCDYKEVDGSVWMSAPTYWGLPCDQVNVAGESLCGQIWNNKWVGIGEPPEVEGSVQVEVVSRVGDTLISPADASGIAQKFVVERRREKSDFLQRRLTGARPAEPMLARELSVGLEEQKREREVRYYIVPFTQGYEVDRTGACLARFSVLVNAYTGRFEQLCVFPRPVRYLSEEDVTQLLSRDLRLSPHEAQRFETELVFQPLHPYVSSALPAWQIAYEDLEFFVAQDGTILGTLNYPSLRGA